MSFVRGRAPLRLGLGGGGTDVEPFCTEFGGRILNVTIDRFAFAFIEMGVEESVEFGSPDRNQSGKAMFDDIESLAIDFPLHVAVYQRAMTEFNCGKPMSLRISTQVDAAPGSGLGSSSSLVVAMLISICEFMGISPTPYDLAQLAWEIERCDLGMAGGWQDQYAAVFGGFNFMESSHNGGITVNPLRIRREVIAELEASLLLYFGGVSRSSSEVITQQQRRVIDRQEDALEATHLVRNEAIEMKNQLVVGNMEGFAESLRIGWEAKKRLASQITTEPIEKAFRVAGAHGMIAGKISGAGGGGYMMMIVDPRRRIEVIQSLERECGGLVTPCKFTFDGAMAWHQPLQNKRQPGN
jgi:D-glycero-alpha-D-manno-heptose-7-phosphate kinase